MTRSLLSISLRHGASRRTVLATTGVALVAASLAACGGSDSTSPEADGSTASPSEELTIGLEGVYKPYNFHDESGKLTGFEVEIAEAIAKKLGRTPRFVEAKWDGLLAGLDTGQYDMVINNVVVNDERKKAFDFSTPYAQAVGKIGVPTGSDIASLEDVKGKRAAQTTTSNWAELMRDAGAEIIPAPGFAEAVELVASGRADVTANEVVAFDSYLEEHPDAPITVLDEPIPTELNIAVAFKKGSDLTAEVNTAVKALLDDGTISGIYTDWLGEDLSPKA